MTLVRELYYRRRWGSNLSIMADGRVWLAGVDRYFGQYMQMDLDSLLYRVYRETVEQEAIARRDESQHRYCW